MADRRLQVFHAVARLMSFTRAAEELCMTQPAVTFQVKQLEEQYNTRLFDRSHGRISLTATGQVVFDYADRILGLNVELDTRIGEMTGGVSGPLLLGASLTIAEFILPRILGEFKACHPDVRTQMTVANSEAIETRVADHSLDVGLIESPSTLPGLGAEVSLADFRKDLIIEVYNEAGQPAIAYKVHRCWVSEYTALPELDASANAVAIQSLKLEHEGWERDTSVTEPTEPSLTSAA